MTKLKDLLKEEGMFPTSKEDALKTTYDRTGGRIEFKKRTKLPFKFDTVRSGSDIVEFWSGQRLVANLDLKTGKIYY